MNRRNILAALAAAVSSMLFRENIHSVTAQIEPDALMRRLAIVNTNGQRVAYIFEYPKRYDDNIGRYRIILNMPQGATMDIERNDNNFDIDKNVGKDGEIRLQWWLNSGKDFHYSFITTPLDSNGCITNQEWHARSTVHEEVTFNNC